LRLARRGRARVWRGRPGPRGRRPAARHRRGPLHPRPPPGAFLHRPRPPRAPVLRRLGAAVKRRRPRRPARRRRAAREATHGLGDSGATAVAGPDPKDGGEGVTRRPHDVLSVITSTDRRGAETFAVGLGAALEARGRSVRTVALAPGKSDGALPVPTFGTSTLAPRTLRSLRGASRDAAVVVAHGSRALPACAIATAGRGQPLVYRNIGDPRYWAGGSAR